MLGICDEGTFHSKVAGVSFIDDVSGKPRQEIIKKYVRRGMELIPYVEKANRATGEPAFALWFKKGRNWYHLGYVGGRTGDELMSAWACGLTVRIITNEITGGTKEKETRGINLVVEKMDITSRAGKRHQARLEKAWTEIDELTDSKRGDVIMLTSTGDVQPGYEIIRVVLGHAAEKTNEKSYTKALGALEASARAAGADAVFGVQLINNGGVREGCLSTTNVLEVWAWGTAAKKTSAKKRLRVDEM